MQIVFVVFPPQFSTTDTWPASDDGRTHIEITSGGKADQTFALPHTHPLGSMIATDHKNDRIHEWNF